MSLRTLHLINGLGAGGSERSLAEILIGARDLGLEPALACFYRRDEGVQEDLVAAGFEVHFVEETGVVARSRRIRELLATGGFELLHTTHFEADVAGRLACRGTGVPVLASLVSTPYAGARFRDPRVNRAKLAAVRAIDGWTGRRWGSHFHAVSNTVRAAAVRETGFAPERITVVERGRAAERVGAPSAERRAQARRGLGLSEHHEVVVHVGRHEYAKGQRYLLEAAAALTPGHPDLVVLVAGRDGAVSDELRTLHADLGLGDQVRFLGHRDDVPEVLAAADVFAFPSLYEGMPGALIEAMALGLPLAASRIDGVVEVVEEGMNALLSEPRNADDLAAHVHELLHDRGQARRFGQASRRIFEERFTLERCVRRMTELFRTVADRAPARPAGDA